MKEEQNQPEKPLEKKKKKSNGEAWSLPYTVLYLKHFDNGPLICRKIDKTEFKNPEIDSIPLVKVIDNKGSISN